MKKLLFLQIILASLLGFVFVAVSTARPVQAKDVDILYNVSYYVESTDRMRVVETHSIKNNSTTTILKQENQDTFVIDHIKGKAGQLKDSVATVKVTVDGKNVPFVVTYQDTYANITVNYPRRVTTGGDTLTFVMQYENVGLIQKTGALFDIYVPGIAKDAVFETDTQSFGYNTDVYISNAMFPEQNFVMPAPTSQDTSTDNITHYFFNRDSITGKTIWIQMGRKQFYHFTMTQEAKPTMSNNLGFKNEYALVLPRDVDDAEIYQKVYFDKILPLPDYTKQDSDGNLIAYFNIPSSDSGSILVEGYVEVGVTGVRVGADNSGSLSDLQPNQLQDALKAADFWEVDHPEIQQVAKNALGSETNIYKILGSTFDFVTHRINYSDVKRFGVNTRQGALATLRSGSGVCMEYSDLFLTIARAQGIPTRAVFGYGYDPQQSDTSQESHQWVVSYLPGLSKWWDQDVTWGDSGQVAEGGYLNHFYTHIVSAGPEALPEVSVTVYGGNNNLELPVYKITADTALPVEGKFYRQADILQMYPYTPRSAVLDWILQVPLKVSAFFGNISNKDALSIAVLTIGFVLLITPIVIIYRRHIDFGGYKNDKEVVVP